MNQKNDLLQASILREVETACKMQVDKVTKSLVDQQEKKEATWNEELD